MNKVLIKSFPLLFSASVASRYQKNSHLSRRTKMRSVQFLLLAILSLLFLRSLPASAADASPIEGEWEPMSSVYIQTLGKITIRDQTISWGKCSNVPFAVVEDRRRKDDFMSYSSSHRKVHHYRDITLRIEKSAICSQPQNILSDPPKEVIRFLIPDEDICYAEILIYKSISGRKPVKLESRGTSYNVSPSCKTH